MCCKHTAHVLAECFMCFDTRGDVPWLSTWWQERVSDQPHTQHIYIRRNVQQEGLSFQELLPQATGAGHCETVVYVWVASPT
jgi:hypothetical protein